LKVPNPSVCGNVKRFRGELVFKDHRLLYHSTLGLRVINKKKKVRTVRRRPLGLSPEASLGTTLCPYGSLTVGSYGVSTHWVIHEIPTGRTVRRRPLGLSPEALSEVLSVAGMRPAATNSCQRESQLSTKVNNIGLVGSGHMYKSGQTCCQKEGGWAYSGGGRR